MWRCAAAMLSGLLLLLALPELPSHYLAAAGTLPFLALGLLRRRWLWLLWLPLGFCWGLVVADQHLASRLDTAYEGRDVQLDGWVHSIPVLRGDFQELEFAVESLDGRAPAAGIPSLVRLSLPLKLAQPKPGEHWRFDARLRRPRGYMDPGGFDYEGWLFQHGFGATGYALKQAQALPGAPRYPLLRLRAALRERIQHALDGDEFSGMAAALATGDQGGIRDTQWTVLQATNTVHLMAIAGLHIGTLAGILFLLTRVVWRRSAWLCTRCPATVAAAVTGFMAATVYATLAGFPLPTQRALIMLGAFTLGAMLRRRLHPSDTLGLAMLGVLLLDPLAAGEVSFWLSFTAVGAILFAFSGRLAGHRGWLLDLLRTQWAVGIGLLPFLAFFFQQAGITSPLANFVMVPLYSLLVVPLVLAGAAFVWIWPAAGALFLKAATGLMALSWPLLDRLAGLPSGMLPAPAPGAVITAIALLGALWLLMPRGMPARALGAVLILPLFVTPPSGIHAGDFDFTLLDVGQGLSAVVRTAGHTLVYDTGPAFQSGNDTGDEVVIPYLRSQGIAAPDLTVVSHGDLDHAGGLASLRGVWPAMPVLSGAEGRFRDVRVCLRGESWEWDGVRFEVLYPDADAPVSGNDASCVLKVSGPGGSLLLTGDIMKKSEKRLLELDPDAVASQVLVAPHHGSNSSSSPPFAAAVAPQAVLFPVGYRNRWDFPKPEVRERYRAMGAEEADTAVDGAIGIRFRSGSRPVLYMRWRRDASRFWTSH